MSVAVPVDVTRLISGPAQSTNDDDTEEALRKVFASHDRDGPLAIGTWVVTWWPWLVLAAGIALVIVGEIVYGP